MTSVFHSSLSILSFAVWYISVSFFFLAGYSSLMFVRRGGGGGVLLSRNDLLHCFCSDCAGQIRCQAFTLGCFHLSAVFCDCTIWLMFVMRAETIVAVLCRTVQQCNILFEI